MAHELRNKLHTAMLAFHVLQSGTVGGGGSTGAVLGRSLLALKELADSTLARCAWSHTTVTLRTRGERGRVFLEVEDECGGMMVPPGTDPFRAHQEPRADGRSGLGLGLSICRKAVEANGGQVRTRDLPGRGCIFEIELPAAVQVAVPAA